MRYIVSLGDVPKRVYTRREKYILIVLHDAEKCTRDLKYYYFLP